MPLFHKPRLSFDLRPVAPAQARYQFTISAAVVAALSFGIAIAALAIPPEPGSPSDHLQTRVVQMTQAWSSALIHDRG